MNTTRRFEASTYIQYKHLTLYVWFEYWTSTTTFEARRYEYALYPPETTMGISGIKELIIERDDQDGIELDFESLRWINQKAIRELLLDADDYYHTTEKAVVDYED